MDLDARISSAYDILNGLVGWDTLTGPASTEWDLPEVDRQFLLQTILELEREIIALQINLNDALGVEPWKD